jgi:hypothetical protein
MLETASEWLPAAACHMRLLLVTFAVECSSMHPQLRMHQGPLHSHVVMIPSQDIQHVLYSYMFVSKELGRDVTNTMLNGQRV